MRKIKKLDEITLSYKESSRVKGGDGIQWPNPPPYDAPNPGEIKDEKPICGCGCSGCVWEDGGGGFSIGMMRSGMEGVHCTFFALF